MRHLRAWWRRHRAAVEAEQRWRDDHPDEWQDRQAW